MHGNENSSTCINIPEVYRSHLYIKMSGPSETPLSLLYNLPKRLKIQTEAFCSICRGGLRPVTLKKMQHPTLNLAFPSRSCVSIWYINIYVYIYMYIYCVILWLWLWFKIIVNLPIRKMINYSCISSCFQNGNQTLSHNHISKTMVYIYIHLYYICYVYLHLLRECLHMDESLRLHRMNLLPTAEPQEQVLHLRHLARVKRCVVAEWRKETFVWRYGYLRNIHIHSYAAIFIHSRS